MAARPLISSGGAALLLFLAMTLSASHAFAQGYSPEEAPRHMTVPEGLEVQLVASEPMVRQPVAIEFDDAGRLWVIQYLQYPNPAGLKRAAVDRYSRTKYDRFPSPPPRGPKGADRITILEDTDGDGRADRAKDFVAGLNLASGLAFGHGGVFVLQVPYLLFYPDRDRDDVPDGDPDVLLNGFGMEDAHSVANSLTLGTRRLAVRLPGEHGDVEHPRHRVSAGRVALPSDHAPLRAVLRRGRQFLGARFRSARQPVLLHQLRRLRHAARRAGGLLLEAVRQARRPAQSVRLRLLRSRAAQESARRTRHRRRYRLSRRLPAGRVPRQIHRCRPAGPCRLLARAASPRVDLLGQSCRRLTAGQRHLVRAERPDDGPRRFDLHLRLAAIVARPIPTPTPIGTAPTDASIASARRTQRRDRPCR